MIKGMYIYATVLDIYSGLLRRVQRAEVGQGEVLEGPKSLEVRIQLSGGISQQKRKHE